VLRRIASVARRSLDGFRLPGDRLLRVAHVMLLLAGVAIGLLLALPVGDVGSRCPPRGEGYALCYLQKALLPTVLLALVGLLAGHALGRLALVRLPAWRRRVREVGERRVSREDPREDPPYRRDPFLLASTWGAKEGRSDSRRPRLRVRRPRR